MHIGVVMEKEGLVIKASERRGYIEVRDEGNSNNQWLFKIEEKKGLEVVKSVYGDRCRNFEVLYYMEKYKEKIILGVMRLQGADEGYKENFKIRFLAEVKAERVESGYITRAAEYVQGEMKRYPADVGQALKEMIKENRERLSVLLGVLDSIGMLEENEQQDQVVQIVKELMSHGDIEVVENAIACLESWCRLDYVEILEKNRYEVVWLEDYRRGVIAEIRQEKEEGKKEDDRGN